MQVLCRASPRRRGASLSSRIGVVGGWRQEVRGSSFNSKTQVLATQLMGSEKQEAEIRTLPAMARMARSPNKTRRAVGHSQDYKFKVKGIWEIMGSLGTLSSLLAFSLSSVSDTVC